MASALNPSQQQVLATALRVARARHASPRETKALVEALSVESNFNDALTPAQSDRDSAGALQQRESQGWGPPSDPLEKDVAQFLAKARAANTGGGSAGQLAQAVQRSGFPGRYDERSGLASQLLRDVGGASGSDSAASSEAPNPEQQQAPWDLGGGGTDAVSVLAQALQRQRPQVQSSGVADPSFSARAGLKLPQGYQASPSGGGPVPRSNGLAEALTAVASLQGPSLPAAETQDGSSAGAAVGAASQASPGGAGGGFSGSMPTAKPGKIIGTPYTGTHTLGNWQSDNAVDIAVPVGTPMVALQDGVVVKVRHHPQGAGRFAGDQITIRGANGNEYFYAHGVADVKAGQKVRKGQELGTTGSANGVAHLHFGQMKGDPRQHAGGAAR